MRIFIAFMVAPILPALIPSWFVHVNRTYDPATTFVFFCGLFYALQIIVGIPAYLMLNRLNRRSLLTYILLGFCSPAIPAFCLTLYRSSEHNYGLSEILFTTLYPGFLGVVGGLIFWLAARPDRRSQSVA